MSNNVVLITPTFPALSGNGLSMRAATTLKLLSSWATYVHLLVIPIYPINDMPEPEIGRLCKSWQMIPGSKHAADMLLNMTFDVQPRTNMPTELASLDFAWQEKIINAIKLLQPDLIVIFRLYLIPFVIPYINRGIRVWLDADELESKARSRIARIYTEAGNEKKAEQLTVEANAYADVESKCLPFFDRVFASSEKEVKAIIDVCPNIDARVLPNVYPRVLPQPPKILNGSVHFLYVGSFGYYPNRDAINFFAKDILPVIKSCCSLQIRVDIVGTGLGAMDDLAVSPELRFIGTVDDVSPYYQDCDIAIVPLRAAGGTRIKILEAFSHKRAVVSTEIGAEGLELTAGNELFVASSAQDFAECCLRLIENDELRNNLASRGHQFFIQNNTVAKIEEMVPQLFM